MSSHGIQSLHSAGEYQTGHVYRQQAVLLSQVHPSALHASEGLQLGLTLLAGSMLTRVGTSQVHACGKLDRLSGSALKSKLLHACMLTAVAAWPCCSRMLGLVAGAPIRAGAWSLCCVPRWCCKGSPQLFFCQPGLWIACSLGCCCVPLPKRHAPLHAIESPSLMPEFAAA